MTQASPRSTQRYGTGQSERAAVQPHIPRRAADGNDVAHLVGAIEVAQEQIDPAVVLDIDEPADAARGNQPFQPLVGPQIAVAGEHARHQDDHAAHRLQQSAAAAVLRRWDRWRRAAAGRDGICRAGGAIRRLGIKRLAAGLQTRGLKIDAARTRRGYTASAIRINRPLVLESHMAHSSAETIPLWKS